MTVTARMGYRALIIAGVLALVACNGGSPADPTGGLRQVSLPGSGKGTPTRGSGTGGGPSTPPKTSPKPSNTPVPAKSTTPSPQSSGSPSASPSASTSPSASPSASVSPSASPSVSPSPSPSPSASPAGDTVTTFAGGAGADDAEFLDSAAPRTARFNTPTAIAVDSAGSFYVADAENRRVRKITSAGVVSTAAGTGDLLVLGNPRGVAVSSTGTVYVADAARHVIARIGAGGTLTVVAGEGGTAGNADGAGTTTARLDSPQGLLFGSDGALYVADTGNHRLRKLTFDGSGNATVSTVAGTTVGDANGPKSSAQLNSPVALARLGTDLLVVESNAHRVRRIKIGGADTASDFVGAFAGSTVGSQNGAAGSAQFTFPSGIAVDVSGNVYVADTINTILRKVAGGQVTTFAGQNTGIPATRDGGYLDAGFGSPVGLVIYSGHLYVTDIDQHNIRKIKLP